MLAFWSMNSLRTVIVASIATFVVTDINELVLLRLFFAQRSPTRNIVLRQYLGFSSIVALSLVGFWAVISIPTAWFRFLGLLRVPIGIKQLQPISSAYRASALALGWTLESSCFEFPCSRDALPSRQISLQNIFQLLHLRLEEIIESGRQVVCELGKWLPPPKKRRLKGDF